MKPYVYIHDIAVAPEVRGKGIGKALLGGIIDTAKAMDCSKVTLEVRDDNPVAQRAYKQLGFDFCTPNMLYWEKPL